MRKPRLSKIKCLAQSWRTRSARAVGCNQICLTPEPMFFAIFTALILHNKGWWDALWFFKGGYLEFRPTVLMFIWGVFKNKYLTYQIKILLIFHFGKLDEIFGQGGLCTQETWKENLSLLEHQSLRIEKIYLFTEYFTKGLVFSRHGNIQVNWTWFLPTKNL